MTNVIEKKIAELRSQKIDTSLEDARIRVMEIDLNRAVSARNESLQINGDIDRKIQTLNETKLMFTATELEEIVDENQTESDMPVE